MTEEFWWAGGINLMTRALLLGNGAGALKSLTSTCKGVVSLSNTASAGCFPQWQSLVTIHIIFSFDSIIFEERRRHFFYIVTKNSEEKLHLLFVQEYNEEDQAVFMGRPGREFIFIWRNTKHGLSSLVLVQCFNPFLEWLLVPENQISDMYLNPTL